MKNALKNWLHLHLGILAIIQKNNKDLELMIWYIQSLSSPYFVDQTDRTLTQLKILDA
jgi:hypothetical protein